MRGQHAGVQERILNLNNRVFFIPCHAHLFSLVVSDAAKSSKDVVSYFSTVQVLGKKQVLLTSPAPEFVRSWYRAQRSVRDQTTIR